MKIQLETIQYTKSQSSFHFFKREAAYFHSYRHFHPELELTYIEQGTGIRYIGDNIHLFEPGDLVLIGGKLPHDYVSSYQEEDSASIAYVFQFPPSILQNIAEGQSLQTLFSAADYGIHFLKPSPALVDKIKRVSTTPSLKNFIHFLDILQELQVHEDRQAISSIAFSQSNPNTASQDKISLVTNHLFQHYQQPITIQQMAQLTNMTPTSFCRWFKQSTGCSFVTYLNATRIEKACQLLFQSQDPIAHISFQTGFETVSHFNRTFKKIKGVTPRAYRKNAKR